MIDIKKLIITITATAAFCLAVYAFYINNILAAPAYIVLALERFVRLKRKIKK